MSAIDDPGTIGGKLNILNKGINFSFRLIGFKGFPLMHIQLLIQNPIIKINPRPNISNNNPLLIKSFPIQSSNFMLEINSIHFFF